MVMPPKAEPGRRPPAGRGVRVLPRGGYQGEIPDWPLYGNPNAEEFHCWQQLWRTPQAAAWAELGWTRVVARYCTVLLAAEVMAKEAMSEARQLEDRLGLTPKAMRMLLWTIAPDEVAEKRAEAPGTSARGRIRAVG